jgi:hypothetical protein
MWWKIVLGTVVVGGGYFVYSYLDFVKEEERKAKEVEQRRLDEIARGKWRLKRENEAIQFALDQVAHKKH